MVATMEAWMLLCSHGPFNYGPRLQIELGFTSASWLIIYVYVLLTDQGCRLNRTTQVHPSFQRWNHTLRSILLAPVLLPPAVLLANNTKQSPLLHLSLWCLPPALAPCSALSAGHQQPASQQPPHSALASNSLMNLCLCSHQHCSGARYQHGRRGSIQLCCERCAAQREEAGPQLCALAGLHGLQCTARPAGACVQ